MDNVSINTETHKSNKAFFNSSLYKNTQNKSNKIQDKKIHENIKVSQIFSIIENICIVQNE